MVRTARPDAAKTPAPAPSPVRERILAAADAMFYAEGIRAVSADRVIAGAGVSKVTFYRHFPTKDDLVLAYVRGRVEAERAAFEEARAGRSARETLDDLATIIAEVSCAPGFRGCPHINAAAEYPDPEHPVRVVVAEHRAWLADALTGLLREVGVRRVEQAVEQLMMLRDGAMIAGYLAGPASTRAAALEAAGRAVLAAAR